MKYPASKARIYIHMTTQLTLTFSALTLATAFGAPLKVMILDGQNNHNWRATTPVLVEALESTGEFDVDICTSPARKPRNAEVEPNPKKWDGWNPQFSNYDVVVSNYNGESWPEDVQKNFVSFVENGGGFVSVHAADNSFPEWKAYNKMIGIGGWNGRKLVRDGYWVHVEDGKVIKDNTTEGNSGAHAKKSEFLVEHLTTDHPITKGLPHRWLHTIDELYCKMCGPAENLEVLGYAKSTLSKRNEPILMTIQFGKGRIFHTTLGHDETAMRCRGFYTLLQRGTEWAASGDVTRNAAVPADFPTEDKTSPVAKP